MGVENRPKTVRGWLIHLLIFILVQGFFMLTDSWKMWAFIYFNDGGKSVVLIMNTYLGNILLYTTDLFNLITIVWGIILIVSGVLYIKK